MSVTQAIEAAGGLTRNGSPKVSLERAQPTEGEPRRIDVDTRAVRSGEAPDPALRPDDALAVKARKI
jgi:protein involved in polysaccharide export with SLBB domain